MSLSAQDERHLQRALELAQEAVGLASPNPTVGCVLVRDGEVLGEGAHHYDERDHAEIAALKQAAARGHSPQNATAYVTLEPCSHHGRTGPCSDALIAARIARCVVATVDPNPLVSGSGLTKLRAAGVDVVVADPASALTQQARQLNDAFAHWIQHHRPFVTLKAAVSVDGKLAPPPSLRTTNQPHWLTGEAARTDVQQLRHAADAILTGIGTVLADDPSLTDRSGRPRRRPLLRVVLDSSLRTPIGSQLVRSTDGDLLLLCSATASSDRESELRNRGVEVLRLQGNEGKLDLRAALEILAQRNIIGVLVEGGSSLNGSLLREGLVDKLLLYYAESELGLDSIPFAKGIASPYVVQQQLQRMERASLPHGTAEDIRITGYLHDPWTGI